MKTNFIQIHVRDTKEHIIVEIGGTDFIFSKTDRTDAGYLEGEYLIYEGQLPTQGT